MGFRKRLAARQIMLKRPDLFKENIIVINPEDLVFKLRTGKRGAWSAK
jgi:hypothetical protein